MLVLFTYDFVAIFFLASTLEENRVAYPHHVKTDPDPAFYLNADLGIQLFTLKLTRIQLLTSMTIRIQLLFKVMEICDHWSINPTSSRTPFEPPGLHCERLLGGRPWKK
jgi:hypothetical protein